MFKFNLDIDDSNLLYNLKPFMLYNIENENIDKNKNNKEDKIIDDKKEGNKVSRNLLYTNYNKLQSKYNERFYNKKISNKLDSKVDNKFTINNLQDKLFWSFYKIINNYTDIDIEHENHFKIEKEYKIELIDKIRKNKDVLKSHKIKKSYIEDDILNNKQICIYTFRALCLLYKINLIIIKDNNTYYEHNFFIDLDDENNTHLLENKNLYNIIKLYYKNSSSLSKNFSISDEIEYTNDDINNIFKNYYKVDNLDNPLKSYSSYKLDDLVKICEKLKINIYTLCNKKKTKKMLYDDIIKELS